MADNEKGNKVRSQDIGTSSSRVNEAPDTSCVTLVQHLINQNRLLIEILQQHQTPILNLSQIQPQVQLEAVQALTPQVSMPPASRRTHGDVTTGNNPTGVPDVRALILVPGGKTEPQTKPYPLDMWKYGSALQQRPEDRSLNGRGATIKTMHPEPSLKPF
uniref:Retrotransposon protein, putative, unclassified n=1 Tax=Oryza sativa subsp. japonica TaxID=39947 RepID=Q33AB7_ORYSJ|nr:retrotransposon protein, putative, unclassified [Oryza sativa Japonica Group]